jgi:hypothetical protein
MYSVLTYRFHEVSAPFFSFYGKNTVDAPGRINASIALAYSLSNDHDT